MKRINSIDMCRGLLFLLMANTHALGLAQVGQEHWLMSDAWLPNGWGTVVFVILSGYGVGFLLSARSPISDRDKALRSRALEIIILMFISNIIFSALRQVAVKDTNILLNPEWWIGFLTLETEWTISGVLLPTALLLIFAPWIIRLINTKFWGSLGCFFLAKFAFSLIIIKIQDLTYIESWIFKFLFTEGFGGFPVFPFLINGFFGIWLGMAHRKIPKSWNLILSMLVLLQITFYFLSGIQDSMIVRIFSQIFGPVGKFGCIFSVAILFSKIFPVGAGSSIEIIGRYALGSFIMHRVFLQTISILLAAVAFQLLDPATRYLILFLGTIFLTWLFCRLRISIPIFDKFLKKIFM